MYHRANVRTRTYLLIRNCMIISPKQLANVKQINSKNNDIGNPLINLGNDRHANGALNQPGMLKCRSNSIQSLLSWLRVSWNRFKHTSSNLEKQTFSIIYFKCYLSKSTSPKKQRSSVAFLCHLMNMCENCFAKNANHYVCGNTPIVRQWSWRCLSRGQIQLSRCLPSILVVKQTSLKKRVAPP